ncbi:MAG: hypothetical protein LBM00_12015 [Deltaproteobacteria bacterium]|nr:hypothetical protein [Deltaproteobacteria bacterium]
MPVRVAKIKPEPKISAQSAFFFQERKIFFTCTFIPPACNSQSILTLKCCNFEMLWRRVPPPDPQAWAKLASAVAAQQPTDEDSNDVSP